MSHLSSLSHLHGVCFKITHYNLHAPLLSVLGALCRYHQQFHSWAAAYVSVIGGCLLTGDTKAIFQVGAFECGLSLQCLGCKVVSEVRSLGDGRRFSVLCVSPVICWQSLTFVCCLQG